MYPGSFTAGSSVGTVLHDLALSLRRHTYGGLTHLGLSTAVVDTEAVLLDLVLCSGGRVPMTELVVLSLGTTLSSPTSSYIM